MRVQRNVDPLKKPLLHAALSFGSIPHPNASGGMAFVGPVGPVAPPPPVLPVAAAPVGPVAPVEPVGPVAPVGPV